MASVIKIKRSLLTATPTTLAEGELAHSEVSNMLFIGTNGGVDVEVIGGKHFTDMLDHTAGTLTASSAIIVDANSKIDNLKVDNIDLNGNTVSASNSGGDLLLTGNGAGAVDIAKLKLNGGTVTVNTITDEDDLDGGSATALATSRAIKSYVDSVASGLSVKTAARVASTADIDLAVAADPVTVDGVTLANGDRILLKNQIDQTENGIYDAVTATDPTTWVRSSDFDEPQEVVAGVFFFVEEGTSQADTGWVVTSDNPLVIGTDPITFTQFSGTGSINAGDGLTKTGNTLDVVVVDFAGAGLEDDGSNNLRIAAGGVSNTMLENNTITVTAGAGLDGGGAVALGSSISLDIETGGVTNAMLQNNSITINTGAGLAGGGSVALGGTLNLTAEAVDPAELAGNGLVDNAGFLDVNVDDVTIEIDTDVVQVKAAGINETHILLSNNEALLARNAADDNVVDLIKLNASDEVVITGLADPTNNTDAVNKEYVDDLTVTVDDTTIEMDVSNVISVKDGGITDAKLAGSIANNKLVNDSVTVVAGSALTGGGEVDLGSSITLNVAVDDSSIEINTDALRIKADGVTNAMLLNDSITITAGTGLTGGGVVALGGSVTLNATAVDPAGLAGNGLVENAGTLDVNVDNSSIEINADALRIKAGGVSNAMLANSAVNLAGDTGTDAVALGETLTFAGDNGIEVDVDTNVITIDIIEVDGGEF